jgi:hypothetical protein
VPIDATGRFRPGFATTAWLADLGIYHIRQVDAIGVIEVCCRLRAAGHPVSLNLTYGLQADLIGTTWNRLPAEVRADLARAYRAALAAPGSP